MLHTTTIKWLLCLFFVFLCTSMNAQNAKNSSLSTTPAKANMEIVEKEKAPVKSAAPLSNQNVPQGNTLEARIARAEFYKAQYAHEPATQAKYQQAIDELKKEQVKTSTTKQD